MNDSCVNKTSLLGKYIKLMRPEQYIKNLFVFAAIIFSNNILNVQLILPNILAFISFCILSSSVYILNDIADVEKDREHPKKRNRPLASGDIKIGNAAVLGVLLCLIALFTAYSVNIKLLIVLALYLINNLFYSFVLKHVVILDVFSIAFGFLFRVLAGSVAIGVNVSNWIILCTFFLSLYLALGKRKSEIEYLKGRASQHRKILEEYSVENINQMMTVIMSSIIVSYALYSTSDATKTLMIFTTIFVVYGVFRYNYILEKVDDGNPTTIVLSDRGIQITVLLWVVSCIIIQF
ncbi:decaprenyl-phosphate phosphoribosyltransferase [Metaclostridioides mangenotii]|uniref:decaprenyl-phosphate phosphoribosyltransferase n=1 Tax=Metaclostridioides mangenotii TaxID=1540 RepID=UPI0026E97F08|nr:decaprenyl-phosphate phosphoribosyltransferase [Clostridioides mangenotii]